MDTENNLSAGRPTKIFSVFGQATGHLVGADVLVISVTAAMTLLVTVWNAAAGLQFTGRFSLVLTSAVCLVGVGLWYIWFRPVRRRLGNLALYSGLWIAWSLMADILTYLVARWAFPLQDVIFSAMDRALGFDWARLFVWIDHMPRVLAAEQLIYQSYYPQALFSVCFLALRGNPDANGRLLLAVTAAFGITVLISGFLPSLGPAEFNHFATAWGATVRALRQGGLGPFDIIGIINFPSFHAVMATMYILIHRDNSIRFYGFAALNTLLLFSTPFVGGHYLIDVLAGIPIALFCWWFAGTIMASAPEPFPSRSPNRTSHG